MLFITIELTPKLKHTLVVKKNISFNLECSHSKVFLDQNFEENQNPGHYFLNSFLELSHLSMLLFCQFKNAAQERYFQTQNKPYTVITKILNLSGVFCFLFSLKYHSGY